MSKKYVSRCLGLLPNDEKMAKMMGNYIRSGKITIDEYCTYLAGYDITANFAKKLIEERKITIAQYLKYFLKNKELLKQCNYKDKAYIVDSKFRKLLEDGNYDVGDITKDIVAGTQYYGGLGIFANPWVMIPKIKLFGCAIVDWGLISESSMYNDDCLVYVDNLTDSQKWKVLLGDNKVSEEALLKYEDSFPEGEDFIEKMLNFEGGLYKASNKSKIFSEEFLLKTRLFKYKPEQVIHVYNFHNLPNYSKDVLEKLGYIVKD